MQIQQMKVDPHENCGGTSIYHAPGEYIGDGKDKRRAVYCTTCLVQRPEIFIASFKCRSCGRITDVWSLSPINTSNPIYCNDCAPDVEIEH